MTSPYLLSLLFAVCVAAPLAGDAASAARGQALFALCLPAGLSASQQRAWKG